MRLSGYFKITLLLSLLSSSALAEDAFKPRIDTNWRYGDERSILMTEIWMPLAQDGNSVLYGDLRAMGDDTGSREGNLGIGYRQLVHSVPVLGDGVAGVHGWLDRRMTALGSHFHQVTLGTEWLGKDYDVLLNGYVPLSGEEYRAAPNADPQAPSFAGSAILVDTSATVLEEPQAGFDLELGRTIPFMPDNIDSIRLYGGGFYFDGPHTKHMIGFRTRLAADITPNVELGARLQRDTVRGTQGYMDLTLRFPFGNKKSYRKEGLRARLDDSPERDIDIVTGSQVIDPGDRIQVLNIATGAPQKVIHVDNTAAIGGDGSIEQPYNTLAAAAGTAADHSVIYVHTGDGTSAGQNTGITLNKTGEQLIGAGANFMYDRSRFVTANGSTPTTTVLIPASTAPVITDGSGNGIEIRADDVKVLGLTVSGASDNNIYIKNANNVNISHVLLDNCAKASLRADFDDNGSYNFNASYVTTTNNLSGNNIQIKALNATTLATTLDHVTADNAAIGNVRIESYDTSSVTASLTNSTLTNANASSNAIFASFDNSTMNAYASSNTINQDNASGLSGAAWQNSTLFVDFTNNSVSNSVSSNILFSANDTATASGIIRDNIADTTTNWHSLLVRATDSGTITDVLVQGNTVRNANLIGLRVDDFEGVASRILRASILDNIIEDNTGTGLAIAASSGGVFENFMVAGNVVTNSTTYGISLSSSSGSIFSSLQNNIVTGNGGSGVNINDDTAGGFVVDMGGGSLGSVGNNSIYSNGGKALNVDLDGGELKAENNWWGSSSGVAIGDMNLDASFGGTTVDAEPHLTTAPH